MKYLIKFNESKVEIDKPLVKDIFQDISDEFDITVQYENHHWGLDIKLTNYGNRIPSNETFELLMNRIIDVYHSEKGIWITIYTPEKRYQEYLNGKSLSLFVTLIFRRDDNIKNRNFFKFF